MFLTLGTVRINPNYMVEYLSCYARENNKIHLCFIDYLRVFPLRDLKGWENEYGINHVTSDHDNNTITIDFIDEKDAIEYIAYLDQFFNR